MLNNEKKLELVICTNVLLNLNIWNIWMGVEIKGLLKRIAEYTEIFIVVFYAEIAALGI